MSLYEVQKLLFHVNREPKMLDRFLRERETLIAEYRLTEKEQRALSETDFPMPLRDGRALAALGTARGDTWPELSRLLGDPQGKSAMSLVGAFAASHAPGITGRPSLPPVSESEPIFRAYEDLKSRLEAARPDVLVVVSPEHWANFFLDNMPSFCIGIADEFSGPTDEKFVNIPRRSVRGNARLARALAEGIAEDVDLSTSQEMAFDHGVMLPLHLLQTELPVIPIIVNCLAGMPAPLHRCHVLGVALRRTVDRWPERVVLLGTGGLSHWPAMPESGQIGVDFDRRFLDAFLKGRIESFLYYPKEKLEAEAGPGGHEIRTWITVAAAAAGTPRIAARLSTRARVVHWLRRRDVGYRAWPYSGFLKKGTECFEDLSMNGET